MTLAADARADRDPARPGRSRRRALDRLLAARRPHDAALARRPRPRRRVVGGQAARRPQPPGRRRARRRAAGRRAARAVRASCARTSGSCSTPGACRSRAVRRRSCATSPASGSSACRASRSIGRGLRARRRRRAWRRARARAAGRCGRAGGRRGTGLRERGHASKVLLRWSRYIGQVSYVGRTGASDQARVSTRCASATRRWARACRMRRSWSSSNGRRHRAYGGPRAARGGGSWAEPAPDHRQRASGIVPILSPGLSPAGSAGLGGRVLAAVLVPVPVQVAVDRAHDVRGADRGEDVEGVLGARQLGVHDRALGDRRAAGPRTGAPGRRGRGCRGRRG